MTNNQIILWESVKLMDQGIIGTTGRKIIVTTPLGIPMETTEPETIHTFAAWKELGYNVKKGQHAIAKIQIWKGAEKALKDEDGNELDEKELRMFRKLAYFFSASQVEKTAEKKPA